MYGIKSKMMQTVNIVILAAGQGKRMNSSLPKVLHPVSTKPMLQHVIDTALELSPERLIVVYGHGGDQVQNTLLPIYGDKIQWAHQDQQLGTGHALKCALPYLSNSGVTLVLYGDVPLISLATLQKMLAKYQDSIVMLTDEVDNPAGYGRVVRNSEFAITGIIEEKDASQSERLIREINTGFYVLPNKKLADWLSRLSNNNNQNEYYLTDVIGLAYQDGVEIDYVLSPHHYEVLGVNNKLQLEQLERIYQLNRANKLLEAGVTLYDKTRIEIRGSIKAGKDCCVDVNCIFEGDVVLGDNVTIGAGCIIKNATIADNVTIKPYTIIEEARISAGAQIGPYARLRPGTELAEDTHVGNFVEIKKSQVGKGSKINHLTYIGDANIGSKVNVGAGSVTCNYDGQNKFKTVIGDNVFVGSGTMLVAPVSLKNGSLIGAGSVITEDTPENELTLARTKQVTVYGWKKRNK
ncbi:bifunctional UDP-N-acetylglucosamine diphosphorylase/glucosamine-1-phosphate N-acetyltransferase GlmU [Aquella oligotrophica]